MPIRYSYLCENGLRNDFGFAASWFARRYLVSSRGLSVEDCGCVWPRYLAHTGEALTFLPNVTAVHGVIGCSRLVGREICPQIHTLTKLLPQRVDVWWAAWCVRHVSNSTSVTSICFPFFFFVSFRLSLKPTSSSVLLLHRSYPPLPHANTHAHTHTHTHTHTHARAHTSPTASSPKHILSEMGPKHPPVSSGWGVCAEAFVSVCVCVCGCVCVCVFRRGGVVCKWVTLLQHPAPSHHVGPWPHTHIYLTYSPSTGTLCFQLEM